MQRYKSNQKLWKVVREVDGYYYEIKLAGMVIDRIKISDNVINIMQSENLL